MNKLNRLATGVVAGLAASATAFATLPANAAPAAAPASRPGTTSLASVLAADGTKFDNKWGDFDITEAAVLAVLEAKPNSPVKLLTKGKTRATAFIPTDRAFRRLVRDLAGYLPKTEKKTFTKVASLGIDTIETVLLYHVVAGSTLTSDKVVMADGKRVETALGKTFRVKINHAGQVKIIDKDPDDRNATALPQLLDINKGNKQAAHGINRVLRPLDL